MKNHHSVIPRTMCLIFHQDEILFIKAGEGKDWTGTYDPVGGHIEKGEDIIDSANREIKEETGLIVTDTKLRGIVHATNFFEKNIMMLITVSHTDSREVVSNHEGELEWVKVADIDKLNTFADVKPIISQILELKLEEILLGTSKFNGQGKLIFLDLKGS